MKEETSRPRLRLQAAATLIEADNGILLVHQQSRQDSASSWALPGGAAEDGELFVEALHREVREETGLEVSSIGSLLYTSQLDSPCRNLTLTCFVFRVESWTGTPSPQDPDGEVFEVCFWDRKEAVQRLWTLNSPFMRDPIQAYLQGHAPEPVSWFFREETRGAQEVITRIPDFN